MSTMVDTAIWRALAGSTVHIPKLSSYVYYFPQGHLEHSFNPEPSPSDSASDQSKKPDPTLKRPYFSCQVISIGFHFNSISDQAFVKIVLQPANNRSTSHIRGGGGGEGEDQDFRLQDDVVSFSKILTPSDANNGGGFSVPRYCADSIFPQLNFNADPPVQNLIMIDSQKNAWEFRHIYRGTPRRHLLTTGWSKFVNAKRLVTGDSVVFMRKRSTGDLFIGVRRAARFGGANGWDSNNSREAAIKAMESADRGMAFEIVYYPRVGMPDFVVSAEKVENALKIYWAPGMRVRISLETEDYSRITVFSGIITVVSPPQNGPWFGSPWRMLQVSWDEPLNIEKMNSANPWQVEWLESSSQVFLPSPPIFPPLKRLRGYQNQELIMLQPSPNLIRNGESSAAEMFNFDGSAAGILQDDDDHHIGLSNSHANSHGSAEEYYLSPRSQLGSIDFDDQQEEGGHRLTSIQLFGKLINSYVPIQQGPAAGAGAGATPSCRDDDETNKRKK